jgi:hypothetical protein
MGAVESSEEGEAAELFPTESSLFSSEHALGSRLKALEASLQGVEAAHRHVETLCTRSCPLRDYSMFFGHWMRNAIFVLSLQL